MRRRAGGGGPNSLSKTLRGSLTPDPFNNDQTQWGTVAAVHGSTSTTLYAAATAGAMTVQTNAAPVVNDMLVIGTLTTAIRVLTVTGSGAPYTVGLAQALTSSQSISASVTALKTLDVYFDGFQTKGTNFLRWGTRYIIGSYPSPAVNDVVVALRSHGGRRTDKIVIGKMA